MQAIAIATAGYKDAADLIDSMHQLRAWIFPKLDARGCFPYLERTGLLSPHVAMVESSRFCVDTSLEAGRAGGSLHDVTLTTFAATIEWSIANGYRKIVTGANVQPRSWSAVTTLANAVISEIVEAPEDRNVILEDTAEIRYTVENALALYTSDTIDMRGSWRVRCPTSISLADPMPSSSASRTARTRTSAVNYPEIDVLNRKRFKLKPASKM